MSGAKRQRLRLIPLKEGEQRDPSHIDGCAYWQTWQDVKTEVRFKLPCRNCGACARALYFRVLGGSLAEAESAALVVSLTLTYADVTDSAGSLVPPDGAKHLDYDDVRLFLGRLRSAGYSFTKVAAGEYGKEKGRAHWHLVLFFHWDDYRKAAWFQKACDGAGDLSDALKEGWEQLAPPIRSGRYPKAEFQSILDDPESLYCVEVGYKTRSRYRNNWRYWPHGKVEAQVIKTPFDGDSESINRGVRYVLKYMSKDPWRDVKAFKHVPFDELPPWIQEATNYGPWKPEFPGDNERKWVRGNAYRKRLLEANLTEFDSDADVPIERRVRVPRFNYRAKHGLGALYFRALGVRAARLCGSDRDVDKLDRRFNLGPNYRKKQRKAVMKAIEGGRLPESVKAKFPFQMTDTNFREFGDAFSAEFERLFGDESHGPKGAWVDMETERLRASDAASGPFGYHFWKDASVERRREMEKAWGNMPDEALRGLVPRRLITLFEETSSHKGWQLKRRERVRLANEGKPKHRFDLGGSLLVVTSKGRVFYTRQDDKGGEWWRREVVTKEQLDMALACELLPPDARAAQLDKEGRGDVRQLVDVDRRTVLRWIKAGLAVKS